jgi:hypothetical protein
MHEAETMVTEPWYACIRETRVPADSHDVHVHTESTRHYGCVETLTMLYACVYHRNAVLCASSADSHDVPEPDAEAYLHAPR